MLRQLLEHYFDKGCSHLEIIALLSSKHGIVISLSTLKRRLRSLRLKRKNIIESPIEEITLAIVTELQASGYNLGYRALHQKLLHRYQLQVKRDTVYYILRLADPGGISDRLAKRLRRCLYRSPGPNFIWHIDGYDKLKPYGFAIHAGIDGFSRYLHWLGAGTTNNDPKVTASFYLKTVKQLGLVPTLLRSDAGTENNIIGSLQTGLRHDHDDRLAGSKSFIVGRSVHNQGIEAFWGQLRKHSMDFYMQFFSCMKERNLFNGSKLHTKCLQFCFGPLIKADLEESRELWNNHRIRKQQGRDSLHGEPYVLYHLPEKYGARDYGKQINLAAVDRLTQAFTKPAQLFDRRFAEIAISLSPDMEVPTDIEEALNLYKTLLHLMIDYCY